MKFKVGTKEYEIKDDVLKSHLEKGTDLVSLVEDAIVRSKSEDDAFVENMKKDARKEGLEIAVKKYRESNNLDFEGKSIESLAKAVADKTVADAKISPDEAVKSYKEKLEAKEKALQETIKKSNENEKLLQEVKRDFKIETILNTHLPKNLVLPSEDIKLILKNKLSFEEDEETKTMFVKDLQTGKIFKKAETGDNRPVDEVIKDFFRTNTQYISKTGEGRGGDDSDLDKDKKLTIDEFNNSMREKGILINSPEYATELNKQIEAKTLEVE